MSTNKDTFGAQPCVTFWILTHFCLLWFQSVAPLGKRLPDLCCPGSVSHHSLPCSSTCEIFSTSSLQPRPLTELPFNMKTKKWRWLCRSFAQNTNSKMKNQNWIPYFQFSPKINTVAGGALTYETKCKPKAVCSHLPTKQRARPASELEAEAEAGARGPGQMCGLLVYHHRSPSILTQHHFREVTVLPLANKSYTNSCASILLGLWNQQVLCV